jgi:lipopolysaccharide/colanic/teichoic acid biosynthesis glycosyltransferase
MRIPALIANMMRRLFDEASMLIGLIYYVPVLLLSENL